MAEIRMLMRPQGSTASRGACPHLSHYPATSLSR